MHYDFIEPPEWAKADIEIFFSTTKQELNKRNARKFSIFLNNLGVKTFKNLTFNHIKEYWNQYGKSNKEIMLGLEAFLLLLREQYNHPQYLHIAVNRFYSRYVFTEKINLDELLQYDQYGPNAEELFSMIPEISEKVDTLRSSFLFINPKFILSSFALFLGNHKIRFSFDMATRWLFQIHNYKNTQLTPARNVFRVTDLMVRQIEISVSNMIAHRAEKYKRKKYPLTDWLCPLQNEYFIERKQDSEETDYRKWKLKNALFKFSEFLQLHGCTGLEKITADLLNKFIEQVNSRYKEKKESNYITPSVRDFLLYLIIQRQFSLNLFLHCFTVSQAECYSLKMLALSTYYGEDTVAVFIRNKNYVSYETKTLPQWGLTILEELEQSFVRNAPNRINGLNEDELRRKFRRMVILLEYKFHPCKLMDLKPSKILLLKDFFAEAYFYAFIYVITERLFPKFYLCLTHNVYIDYSFIRDKVPIELASINGQWTWDQIYEKTEDVVSHLEQLSYKKNNKLSARLAINCLCILCLDRNLLFNKEFGYTWAKFIKKKFPKTNFAFNVSIYILECILKGEIPDKEDIVNERIRLQSKPRNYPNWSRDLIDRFIQNIRNDYLGRSAIDQYHSALLRFTAFLNLCGYTSFNGITPDLLKKFDGNDHHSTFQKLNWLRKAF